MLKLKDILAAANAKVAEYMAQGYMISWMNASFGYKFRVDLEKNGDRVRVKVDSFHNWERAASIEGLTLQVVRISCADAFAMVAARPSLNPLKKSRSLAIRSSQDTLHLIAIPAPSSSPLRRLFAR